MGGTGWRVAGQRCQVSEESEAKEGGGEVNRRGQYSSPERRAKEAKKEEQKALSSDDEGSVAAGAALAQPSQLHRQSGQPAHPLF